MRQEMNVYNSSISSVNEIWNFLETDKFLAPAVGVIMIIMSPFIVVENALVILVISKDPLQNLRSFTSTMILLSMAIADFLVGSILCPMHSYWSLKTADGDEPTFPVYVPLAINAIFISVSVGHVMLLTIDRLVALLTPLQYRFKVTSRCVSIAVTAIWCYALVLGVLQAVLDNYFIIFSIIYTAQVLTAFFAMICINTVILYHFRKDSPRNVSSMVAVPIRHFYQREKHLSKAIAVIVCANVVCFTPWLVIEALLYYCMICRPNLDSLMKGLGFSSILIYLNSVLNPLLYSWRLKRFRESLKRLFPKDQHRVLRYCEEPEHWEHEVFDTKL